MSNINTFFKDEAAKQCAMWIINDNSEHQNYQDFIEEGGDPREHILYSAYVVLGGTKRFDEDIELYETGERGFA